MSVDHSISSGYGYIVELPKETVDELYGGDGLLFIEAVLKTFPDLQYIVGGSYYEADNIHFAIVVKGSGFDAIEDMAGICIIPTVHTVTDSAFSQLDEAYHAITGDWPEYPLTHLVAGLWH